VENLDRRVIRHYRHSEGEAHSRAPNENGIDLSDFVKRSHQLTAMVDVIDWTFEADLRVQHARRRDI